MIPDEAKASRKEPWIPPPAKTTLAKGAAASGEMDRILPEQKQILNNPNLQICKRARVLLGDKSAAKKEARPRRSFSTNSVQANIARNPNIRRSHASVQPSLTSKTQQTVHILTSQINSLQAQIEELLQQKSALLSSQDNGDLSRRFVRESHHTVDHRETESKPVYTDLGIQALQAELMLRRTTIHNLMEELQRIKNDHQRVKDGLKKAVIVQRERAKQAEREVSALKEQIDQRDAYILELQKQLFEERRNTEEYTEREEQTQLERRHMVQRLKELEQQVAESIAGSCETLHKLVNQYQSHVLRQIPDGASPAHVAAAPPAAPLQNEKKQSQNIKLLEQLKDTNDLLRNEIGRKDVLLRQCSEQLEGKIREVAALAMRPSASQPDLRSSKMASEKELEELRRHSEVVKREKKEAEARLKIEISELKEKLLTSQAKNEAAQQYLQAVRSSYTSMFGGSLPDPVTVNDDRHSSLSL